eukprot:9197847-Pyramimonas_sp.AAC.1
MPDLRPGAPMEHAGPAPMDSLPLSSIYQRRKRYPYRYPWSVFPSFGLLGGTRRHRWIRLEILVRAHPGRGVAVSAPFGVPMHLPFSLPPTLLLTRGSSQARTPLACDARLARPRA